MTGVSTNTITPYLWFTDRAEEAVNRYVSIFPNSRITSRSELGDGVVLVEFELLGQRFVAMKAADGVEFTMAVSFLISCDTQEEVDHYWNSLIADGGEGQACGWLKDAFGVSWQVIPGVLMECLGDPDPERAQRATQAMFQMSKIDIAGLLAAMDGVPA
jgi:predicted 3-demethylubiquinone-9 3-methyltransferase (glyoxalase superfamily)